jgi:benzylsuccinate CoA-transferase BbsF subunit
MTGGVFKDIHVIEFTTFGIGPNTGRFFSNYGATVIRIESSLRPDPVRMFAPYANGKPGLNRSVFWANSNVSKHSISLNLNHPFAIKVARRLIRWCDIVIENFVPGVMERWGLSYEQIKEIKPDVILIRLSNLGHTGPESGRRGTGGILQSLAGFVDLMGWPDRGPASPYGAISDQYPPLLGAASVIAALLYRRRTGKGQYLDFSQLECSVPFLSPLFLDYTVNKQISSRIGNSSPCAAPHGAYRCKGDDRWCVIAVFTEQEWLNFCQVIGNPPWVMETRFSNLAGRKANESELDKLVEEWTRTKTPEEVMNLMQAGGVPSGIVENAEDMNNDPQLNQRNHFNKVDHPEIGTYSAQEHAFRLSRTQSQIKRAPCLGEDNEFVYKEILGMSDEEYIELLLEGACE